MNLPLEWRLAKAGDRALLEAFTCAPPWPKDRLNQRRAAPSHPQSWAWEVQADIRKRGIKCGPRETLLLGLDGDHLAVVSRAELVEADAHLPEVRLQRLGVALKYQRNRLAEAALDLTVDHALRDLHDPQRAFVVAAVHRSNEPCRRVVARWGMRVYERATFENPYDVWGTNVDLQ